MATMQEAVRRLTIETVERGADQAKAKLGALAGAQRDVATAGDAVTVATEKTGRAMVKVEREFARAQTRYDAVARAERELANVHTLVAKARAQGIGTEEAYERLLTSVTTRHAAATTAITSHAQAVRSLNAANQNAARSSGGQNFNTANVAAQFQDIGVTAAMGMSPMMIALQQGTQLSAVFGQTGAAGAVRTLGAAFMSLVSPVSLVTIGLVAAGAAGIQYFTSAEDGAAKADEALKAHEDAIRAVAQRWGEVVPELQRYADETSRARDLEELRQAAQDRTNALLAEARTQMAGVAEELFRLNTGLLQSSDGAAAIASLENAFGNLQTKLADGTAQAGDLKAMQDALAASFTSTSIPAVDQLAQLVGNLADRFADAADQAARLNQQTTGAVARDGIGISPYGGGRGADPRSLVNDTYWQNRFFPKPEKAEKAAGPDPRTERANSMQQTIDMQRLELSLIGRTGNEAAALRSEFQWLAAAREDAAKRGVAVDEAEIAMIQEKRKELEAYLNLTASKRLMTDLSFERDQFGRSSRDQQIASRLQGAGLPVDMNSQPAQALRENMQFETLQSDVTNFFNDFRTALENNGGNLGEALSTSIQNAALRAFDRTMEDLINSISNMLARALQGQGGLSGSSLSPLASAAIAAGMTGLFADGAAINRGNVIPFARGGVVSGPTLFPMANGAGLMGEAGPEAVMPLRRMPSGRLGVETSRSGGSSGSTQTVQHVVTVKGVFVDDGGVVKAIAQTESASAASRVASAVPSIAAGSSDETRVRRIRARSF